MQKKKYARFAALLVALAITGAGWMPTYGADNTVNGEDNTFTGSDGNTVTGNNNTFEWSDNNVISGDGNIVGYADGNTIIGDTNTIKNFDNSLIWGNRNKFYASYSGFGTATSGAMVIGSDNTTKTSFDNGIIFGNHNNVTGGTNNTLLMGHGIQFGSGSHSVVIGNDSTANGLDVVLVGGNSAQANGTGDVVIGGGAKATESGTANAIAIGHLAENTATENVLMGSWGELYSGNSVAVGDRVSIGEKSQGSVAIGGSATIGEGALGAIAIGGSGGGYNESKTVVNDGAYYSIAMGKGATISEDGAFSMAMGYESKILNGAQGATAIGGYMASAGAGYATALGSSSNASAGYATALGSKSNASALYATALGPSSTVSTDYSVAVGYNSTADADDIFTAEDLNDFKLREDYTDLYNIKAADIGTAGVFSVGSAGGERRIINVARGRISADSTDAVNGSQLYGAVQYLEGKIDNLENASTGGGEIMEDDDNITIRHPAGESAAGTATENTVAGSMTETAGMNAAPVMKGEETTAGTKVPDNTHYVGLAEDVVLGDTSEGAFTPGSLTVKTDDEGHAITINKKENESAAGDGLVSGLANTEWDWKKYDEGGYEGSTNAATESQLHELVGGIEQDITDMGDQITNMGDQITSLGSQVSELDGRIDEVGAGAAALSALHPLDFDPDDKWDFAAGYGHYRSENAVAVGAFYRPNEDTMFSIGGTVGNGDEMINAGVSFKIGQGNHVSISRVAMAKEIIELRKDLEDLRSVMASGVTGDTLDLSKIQLFPDIPENHWAYDYVATLAGNGVLEGYPDGYFNGDRPITRYEMAAVLYRAMQKGVRLSDRALREFAPELDRIRVDTITKDKQGMPEIQRVRVIKGRE